MKSFKETPPENDLNYKPHVWKQQDYVTVQLLCQEHCILTHRSLGPAAYSAFSRDAALFKN